MDVYYVDRDGEERHDPTGTVASRISASGKCVPSLHRVVWCHDERGEPVVAIDELTDDGFRPVTSEAVSMDRLLQMLPSV